MSVVQARYLWILWKIRYFQENMKKLPNLTFPGFLVVLVLLGLGCWAFTYPKNFQELLKLSSKIAAKQATDPVTSANSPASSSIAGGKNGNDLIQQARLMMQGQNSAFTADILQIIQTPETSYRATGTYAQTSDLRSRLEINMNIQGIQGRLLQVSNGQVSWIVRELKNLQQIRPANHEEAPPTEEVQIERIDLQRLYDFAQTENVSLQDPRFAREFASGIPGLLAAIEAEMDFTLIKRVAIQDIPHYVLQGEWKVPLDQKKFEDSLSAQIFAGAAPERIRIYLRASDLMLVRYMCLKKRPKGKGWYAPLAMELSNIVVNGDVSQIAFHWQPEGDQVSEDVTHKYLDRLQKVFQINQNPQPE